MRSILTMIAAAILLSLIGGCEYDEHHDHRRDREFDRPDHGRYYYDRRYDDDRDYDHRRYRDYDRDRD